MFRSLVILGIGVVIGATIRDQRDKAGAKLAHKIVDAVFGEDPRRYRNRPYDQTRD